MSGTLRLKGSTSGYSELKAPDVAGDQTFILPAVGGDLLTTDNPAPFLTLESGVVTAPSLRFEGDLDTGLYSPAANQIGIVTNSNEQMRIDSNGRVGIGTSSPDGLLHVSSTGTTRCFFEGNNGKSEIRASNGNLSFFTNQDANVSGANRTIFYRNGSNESMRINEDGKIGIGTNNPQTPLHVSASNAIIRSQDSDGTNQYGEFAQLGTQLLISSRNDGSNGAIIFRGLGGGTADEYARFTTAGRFYINRTTGNVELDVEGKVRASTGILFGTDTAADNTLDDYEEGTFTPAFQAGAYTYTDQTGTYTKIGNKVTVWLSISWSSRPSGENVTVNLPFAAATGLEQSGTISDNGNLNYQSSQLEMACSVGSGTSVLTVHILRDGLSRLTTGSSALATSATFTASISYQV